MCTPSAPNRICNFKIDRDHNFFSFLIRFFLCPSYYRAMLCRARLWDCMSSVCLSIRLWRWGMFFTPFGTLQIKNTFTAKQLRWPQRGRSGAAETPPKLGWNRGGSGAHKSCKNLRNGARLDQGLLLRTNRKSHTRLNGWNIRLAEIKSSYTQRTRKNVNEDTRYRQNLGRWFYF